ncbi:MAG: N-acetylglucosamine-6-phosphate deacetylase [Clostridiaceae bacterium]
MKTLIKNVKIIKSNGIIKGSVVLDDGKIKEILAESVEESEFENVIDGNGKYLSAGFIDIHNHGNFGKDAMEGTYEALDTMASFHIKNGVTGFLATTMTDTKTATLKAIKNTVSYINEDSGKIENKSKVLGIHMEGPYFSLEKKGAQPGKGIKAPELQEIEEYIKASEGKLKLLAIAPEVKGAAEAVRYLKGKGVTVSLGHSNGTYIDAIRAIEAGATEATHLYNGMRSFSQREPGIIGAVLTDPRVRCELICDGIHVHPAAMKMAYMLKGEDGIILISDAMMATGLEDGWYTLGIQDVLVENGVARLKDGTLAGSTLTLNKAVYNMVNKVQVPLYQAVKMASLNPAKAIKEDDKKGSIERGKDADLIIFDDNINIEKAFISGKLVYEKIR